MILPLKKLKEKVILLFATVFVTIIIMSNSNGTITTGHGGRTAAPFDSSGCGNCHVGGTYTGTYITLELYSGSTLVTSYVPGVTYTLKVRVASTSGSTLGYHYGFQVVCVQSATDTNINGWGTLPVATHSATWNARTYIEQSSTLFSITYPTISIPWTAPAAGTGNVTFFGGGCKVNNDGLDTLDNAANTNLVVSETACIPASLLTAQTDVSCFGGNDGTINLSASGGSGVSGYSWSGPSGFTASTTNLSGLYAGTYTVVVTAIGGCKDTAYVTVSQPPALTLMASSNAPVCNGDSLFLYAATTGGTGSIIYGWSGPSSFVSGSRNPVIDSATPGSAGIYTISVVDSNSCTNSTTVSVVVSSVTVNLGHDTTICPGDSMHLGAPPIPGYTYLWSTGATSSSLWVLPGTYTVTETNSLGCTGKDSIVVHLGVCTGVGISEYVGMDNIRLFPNPVQLTLHIESSLTIDHVSVSNLTGIEVQNNGFGGRTGEIIVSQLPAGLYFATIVRTNGQKFVMHFIKE